MGSQRHRGRRATARVWSAWSPPSSVWTALPARRATSAPAEPIRANTRIAQVGDPPSGLAASAQPVVVAVQLTDSSGRVLPGVPVSWKPLDGGTITAREARSDSAGEAHADWRLGPKAGVQRA